MLFISLELKISFCSWNWSLYVPKTRNLCDPETQNLLVPETQNLYVLATQNLFVLATQNLFVPGTQNWLAFFLLKVEGKYLPNAVDYSI